MPRYNWYQKVRAQDPLLQGDFIRDCPIIIPPTDIHRKVEGDVIEPNVDRYNIVVLSQSCDLEQDKIKMVLVCPYLTLTEVSQQADYFKSKEGKNQLKRGNVVGYHLLNVCKLKDFGHEFLVVDFKNAFSIPVDVIRTIARNRGPRLRLLPPYREHLAQAFARFFMRVGLPIDIPDFR